jgi:hypothetical protein
LTDGQDGPVCPDCTRQYLFGLIRPGLRKAAPRRDEPGPLRATPEWLGEHSVGPACSVASPAPPDDERRHQCRGECHRGLCHEGSVQRWDQLRRRRSIRRRTRGPAGLQSGRQEINKQSEADRAAKPAARGRGIASQNGFDRKLESYLQGGLRAPPVERAVAATTCWCQQARTSPKLGW